MKIIRGILLVLLLTFTGFFFVGWVSSLTVPKGSGLAGPGIVAGYALFGAIAGLGTGLILVAKARARRIVIINIVLAALIIIPLVYLLGRKSNDSNAPSKPEPKTTVSVILRQAKNMGLGMAKPDFYNHRVLYFYAPNLEKAANEHSPIDSVVFEQTELGMTISYAPPWFYPEHLKIDYGILFLKTLSRSKDWIQVEVNRQNGMTYWIDATKASIVYWPEFLLNVFSLASIGEDNPLRTRPFENSSPVKSDSNSFQPIEIKDEWVKVHVLDKDLRRTGEGWLRWKRGSELLVKYYLLS